METRSESKVEKRAMEALIAAPTFTSSMIWLSCDWIRRFGTMLRAISSEWTTFTPASTSEAITRQNRAISDRRSTLPITGNFSLNASVFSTNSFDVLRAAR